MKNILASKTLVALLLGAAMVALSSTGATAQSWTTMRSAQKQVPKWRFEKYSRDESARLFLRYLCNGGVNLSDFCLKCMNDPDVSCTRDLVDGGFVEALERDAGEIVDKVREAASTLSKTGDLAQFNQKQGPWVWKNTYIFIEDCDKKVVAAHPIKPELIGQDLTSIKDAKSGKSIFPDPEGYCKTVRNSQGVWNEYWWPKPDEKEASRKFTYHLSADGTPYVVSAGIYVGDDNTAASWLEIILTQSLRYRIVEDPQSWTPMPSAEHPDKWQGLANTNCAITGGTPFHDPYSTQWECIR